MPPPLFHLRSRKWRTEPIWFLWARSLVHKLSGGLLARIRPFSHWSNFRAVTLEIVAVPQFKAGDRVLLFVEGNGVQFCPLVGVYHGKFGVRKDDKSRRDTVFMHDGKPLRDVAEIGAGEGAQFGPTRARLSIPAEREPMALDDFKARIRLHLAKKAVR